jgi:hypothetical protein
MQHSSTTLPVILTGDRTTGPLHLGHYVGSLKNRVTLQTTHQQYLLLADAQALTDNAHNPGRVRDNVLEIAAGLPGCRDRPEPDHDLSSIASSGTCRFDAAVHELCHGGAA